MPIKYGRCSQGSNDNRFTRRQGDGNMNGIESPDVIGQWVNYALVWVGFGTLVGLLAKAIMPGRDPGGVVATLLMGVVGSIIGAGVLAYFWNGARINPISPLGCVTSTAGAFILLFFYRLLAGNLLGDGLVFGSKSVRKPRPRRRVTMVEDE